MTVLAPVPGPSRATTHEEILRRIEAHRSDWRRPCTHRVAWKVDVATGRIVRAECPECH